ACNGTCRQSEGQQCLIDGDCSSKNCGGSDTCGCSSAVLNTMVIPMVWVSGTCAVDADCCDAVSCTHYHYLGTQIGTCCNQVGGDCQNDGECCTGSCVNGACSCVPVGEYSCYSDGDCCTGSCFFPAPPLTGGLCWKTAGEQCGNDYECLADSCI